MKTPGDYIAQKRIGAPGTMVAAYQAGDEVTADVVEAWGLSVPDQVKPVDGYEAPRPAEESTDRAAWEAYVMGQGTLLEDARAASLGELRGLYDPPERPAHEVADAAVAAGQVQPIPPDEPAPAPRPEPLPRPNAGALKSAWVEYVESAGADPGWASADTTTKDDLMGWEPSADG